jgi:outer membrane protein assembly factor BamD (BamD/ComL family)
LGSLFGADPTNVPVDPARETDLATTASSERLPQVSVAVLRTRIQQEQDPARRLDLTRRLVALLVSGARFDEAVAVASTADAAQDPSLAYWKAVALSGTGDYTAAKEIIGGLLLSKKDVPGVPGERVALLQSRILRGSGDPGGALQVLASVPADTPIAEDLLLEKGANLIALGQTEECLKLLQTSSFTSDEGKAAAAYLKALATWRAGNISDARKLFAAVPPATPWSASASTLGTAICLGSSKKEAQAIALLEKHLESVDDAPLLAEQFLLLERLRASVSPAETTSLRKWADDNTHPVRAKYASYYLAKSELKIGRDKSGEKLLESFIGRYPDDPLADEARLLLSSGKLAHGNAAEAFALAADRPSAPSALRARLAYMRGLAAAASKRNGEAAAFREAATFDPRLATDALFNQAVLAATAGKGSLDASQSARAIAAMKSGKPSEEMQFQIALDLARRGLPSGPAMLGELAEGSPDPAMKSRARLAAAELNMKSGRGEAADRDLAKAVRENSGEPEREEYLAVFLKDTGRKADSAAVIKAARDFLKAHPDSRFVPEVRLKLAESLLASGDIQGARVEFEQLAASCPGTDLGRRALFLAAHAASRSMDPSSIDDSLMLLEKVAGSEGSDQLAWQARLQEGALKNAQNLPLEALAIYGKILSSEGSNGPDAEIRAAALMASGDTRHQLGASDPSQEREAVKAWRQLTADSSMPLRWRNQALCKSGMVLEKLGEGDAALAAYYEAFKNPRTTDPEQQWHDKAAFDAARLLEARKQWNDAVALYGQIVSEGGARADEAKARLSKLKLENFLWEN